MIKNQENYAYITNAATMKQEKPKAKCTAKVGQKLSRSRYILWKMKVATPETSRNSYPAGKQLLKENEEDSCEDNVQ